MLQNQTPIDNQFYNCKSVNFNFQIRAIHAVDERTLADEMSSLITAEQILWCWPPAAHTVPGTQTLCYLSVSCRYIMLYYKSP